MRSAPAVLLLHSLLNLQEPAELPEGTALVRGLASRQRAHEEALNDYTYDVLEVRRAASSSSRGCRTRTTVTYDRFRVEAEEALKALAPR